MHHGSVPDLSLGTLSMHILNGNCNGSSIEFTIAHAPKGMPLAIRFSANGLGGYMSIANILGKCKNFEEILCIMSQLSAVKGSG